MLLLVDAGNTRVKWALVDPGESGIAALGRWVEFGSVECGDVRQLAESWRALNVTGVMLSNVAGPAMRKRLEDALLQALKTEPAPIEWFVSAASAGGLRNAYRNPAQLGCDRFAAAIGAHAMYPDSPLIVACCGTATTIDAVTADGVFLGGMILPGLRLMAASLAANTAQLPPVAHDATVLTPFADNTDDAIVSGCIAAQAGAIERAVAAHARQYDAVQCILSGGAAAMIAPHLSAPCNRVDNLVLIGLQALSLSRGAKQNH